jgi:imidazolonepropionase-like amidohydrolase
MHEGWGVLVRGRTIDAAGPLTRLTPPAGAERVALAGLTLLPGLVESHSHLLLHPYNETSWNDLVLRESIAYRAAVDVAAGHRAVARAHRFAAETSNALTLARSARAS